MGYDYVEIGPRLRRYVQIFFEKQIAGYLLFVELR